MPVFVVGASFGRLAGESIATIFPDGLHLDSSIHIFPGVYAVVGAAAFCGAVTHTVSVAVIVFEMTGQLVYILPVMMAVLIANAICSYMQPSIYDSMIKIKHLPYLPAIPPACSLVHGIRAEQIMVHDVKFLCKTSTYGQLMDMLVEMPRLKAFPIVDDPESMVLLGSIPKRNLAQLIEDQVGSKARKAEVQRRLEEGHSSRTMEDLSEKSRFMVVPVNNSIRDKTSSPELRSPSPSDGRHQTTNGSLDTNGLSSGSANVYSTLEGYVRSLTSKLSVFHSLSTQRNSGRVEFDMDPNERKAWESERLKRPLNMEELNIDPAPFQLVERTSLFKVHSLFSLLGLNRAYVTNCGRLVGVVALRELRASLERIQAGPLLTADEQVIIADFENSPSTDNSDIEDNILESRQEVVDRASETRPKTSISHQKRSSMTEKRSNVVRNRPTITIDMVEGTM